MTRALLLDLAMVWSLESCDADARRDFDEAARLSDEATMIRAGAEALRLRDVLSDRDPPSSRRVA